MRAQVAELLKQHLGLVGRLAHIGIDTGQLLQLAHGLAYHIHSARHLAVLLREDGLRRLRQVHQRFRIAQAPALRLQFLLFPGAQVGGSNLTGLI